ncbi:MAG: 5-(carboxyamino)imidazole ribonucleotide synthase [Phycisphaeraceae bacterium]|nr:5-(carboxyamino)imidazole ribonucleotide synthase [Phycisphaeraceae bacterium]
MSETSPILPGATLGVLGGGQLGRMFAIAARRMGYRVHVLVPGADSPTGQVADLEINTPYDDLDAVARFAEGVSAVTYEFENVPAPTARCAAEHAPLRPGGHVLKVAQDRVIEKTTLDDAGLPVTPFRPVDSREALAEAIDDLGLPAVLKTARFGYDGKGQTIINTPEEADDAWHQLNTDHAVLEAFIEFTDELSVVGARGVDGAFTSYGPIRNDHVDHILDLSVCPGGFDPAVVENATEIARSVFDTLDVVGVLCVEMFLTSGGDLLINELAPRPHNSGHLTVDAHATCQFAQQVRTVCGLPLGSVDQPRPAAMVNLLGDLWADGEPDWPAALAVDRVHLHLYGKKEPRPGRKMGHLTATADTPEDAVAAAKKARDALTAH